MYKRSTMKPKYIIVILYNIFNMHMLNANRILILQNLNLRSYSNLLESIALTLASEHKVTFINRLQINTVHPNITFIKMMESGVNIAPNFPNTFEIMMQQDDISDLHINIILINSKEYVDELMNNPAITYLFEKNIPYDVLIMPTMMSDALLPFAHFLNVPLIQVTASYPCPWQNEAIGNPNIFSAGNSLILSSVSESFYDRFVRFIRGSKLLLRYKYDYLPTLNRNVEKYFPPNTPKIEEIYKNTSLLLVNTQDILVFTRPTVSNTIEIGGHHCRPAKELPKEFKKFMERANETGLIYMSFGASVRHDIPHHLLTSFINVFRKIQQRVIIKLRQTVTNVPSNVMISKWCPQQDILGHPNTKLFITQGGMLSLQESVYHGVPTLILPLVMDQSTNAVLVNKLGCGKYLRLSQFTEEEFLKQILEVLSNKKYSNQVQELSSLVKDVYNKTEENFKWWIKHIIRHRGLPRSRYYQHKYSHWTNCIEADILIFLIFLILFIMFIFVVIIRVICRFVNKFRKFKKE